MENSPSHHRRYLDRLAVTLSGVCLVHCLLLSAAAISAPALVSLSFDAGWTHLAMLVLVIPVSILALPRGYREHGRPQVLWLGGLGMTLLALGATVGHHLYGPAADTALTVSGALTLAAAHLLNALWCGRSSEVPPPHGCECGLASASSAPSFPASERSGTGS
ncbi:MAG: MerC domain-containing protein [Gammaproteobacteria bacterium]